MPTHEVTNQVPPLQGYDVVGADAVLVEGLARWGTEQHDEHGERGRQGEHELHGLGRLAGTEGAQRWGDQADRNPPRLVTHDPRGVRVDEVEFHPAWHELLTVAVGHGLTAEPWTRPAGSGAHLRRAAGFVAWSQVEAGHGCPVSMTYAAAPALARDPLLSARWLPLLASRTYDPVLRPAADKAGALAGMGMTEKQGGSDVRANTTRAVARAGGPLPGRTYRLTGHKWFTSAPMDDVFLVLARTGEDQPGPSCFVVPRVLDDGSRNVFALQRLKDKLGNRSNASSEVELDGTWGTLLGEEGRGVRAIIDMVGATRLDCVLGSSATMRQALVRAVHHARHRHAFGRALVDQPAMTNVLADLALESEAATLLGLRLAHAVDAGETAFARLAVAVGKYWVCKRTAPMVAEALECLGGNGYVEENGLARLYREAPLNSVWEGSGTVNALDVVRALSREPLSLEAVAKELTLARGVDRRLDHALDDVLGRAEATATADPVDAQFGARRLVEDLALVLQAALVVRHSPAAVAEAFLASRLAPGRSGRCFGTLGPDLAGHARDVVARALPR